MIMVNTTEAYLAVASKFKEALAYQYTGSILRYLRYPALLIRRKLTMWLWLTPAIIVSILKMWYELGDLSAVMMWIYLITGALNITFLVWLMVMTLKASNHVYYTTGIRLEWKHAVALFNQEKELEGWLK